MSVSNVVARYFVCDANTVAKIANERGFKTPEQLALKMRRDAKTIRKVFNGLEVYRSTVQAVADFLGVKPDDLKVTVPTIHAKALPGHTRKSRTITIELPDGVFDDVDAVNIVIRVSKDSQTQDEIVVEDDRNGSRIIEIETSDSDALRIIHAFIEGKLAAYSLISVAVGTPIDMPPQSTIEHQEALSVNVSSPKRTEHTYDIHRMTEVTITAQKLLMTIDHKLRAPRYADSPMPGATPGRRVLPLVRERYLQRLVDKMNSQIKECLALLGAESDEKAKSERTEKASTSIDDQSKGA